MEHAYASLNKTLAAVWADIVGVDGQGKPLVPVVFEEPTHPDTLPDECLRIYWLSNGGSTGQPNELEGMVQLDVYVPKNQRAIAQARCAALGDALGFTHGAGEGEVGRYDWTTNPPTYMGEMTISPLESGWIRVPDPKPGMVHFARTIVLTYLV
jgi:hypothetical protein